MLDLCFEKNMDNLANRQTWNRKNLTLLLHTNVVLLLTLLLEILCLVDGIDCHNVGIVSIKIVLFILLTLKS